jgi:Flp pilus assembly pilin Flp
MKKFWKSKICGDESGAVTVDWVVLTAAIVGVAIAMISVVRNGVEATATDISTAVTTQLS